MLETRLLQSLFDLGLGLEVGDSASRRGVRNRGEDDVREVDGFRCCDKVETLLILRDASLARNGRD